MKAKNHYIVAILSFYDNVIKQHPVYAETPYEAVTKAMIENQDSEEGKQNEIEWQKSKIYPKEIENLEWYLADAEIVFSVIEVSDFIIK